MDIDSCGTRGQLESFLAHIRSQKESVEYPTPRMNQIEAPRAKLAASAQMASSLSGAVEQAAYTATGVSSRVKSALELYERARQASEYVDSVLTLRTALVAMQDGIDTKNWERAAAAAKRALDIPDDIKRSELALKMVPSTELPDDPEGTLKMGCDGMAAFFIKEFDIACAARDTSAITRWFKLLPQVNHHKDGLQRYARFIAGIVAGQSRNLLSGANNENQSLYGIAMARLFESIAAILDQHCTLVETYYGDSMSDVIDVIQNEIDVQGGLIIDTWSDERNIDSILDDIKAYQYPGIVNALGIPTEGYCDIDLNNVILRTSEIHLMLNRWQLYRSFLQRWPAAQETLDQSALNQKFKSILQPCFDKMAVFVFRRSVERAIEQEQFPTGTQYTADQPLVTSMLDDITMVLSSLVDQALDTSTSTVEQTVFASLLRVLQLDYARIIDRKISAAKTRFVVYVYLNDLEVTSGYVEKIVERAKDQYRDQDLVALEKIPIRFKETVQNIIGDTVKSQYNSTFSAAVRTLCGQVFRGTYLMSPTEPESSRGIEFEEGLSKMVANIKETLHPSIYIKFMNHFAQNIARLLEKWIMSLESKVNELGAIALNRDVSKIVHTISKPQYSLRDHFAKVASIVMLIETGQEDENMLTRSEMDEINKILV